MRALPLLALAALALSSCGYPETEFRPQAKANVDASGFPPPATPAEVAAVTGRPAPQPAPPAPRLDPRKPFIVIHFETPQPDYAQDLYEALKGALAKKPSAQFDLVAVTRDPDAAERSMTDVMHTITQMGMPAERLSLSSVAAADDGTNEVWIYVR
ncbi:MAG TPA: hypothetical protein VLV50_01110 [Stellaceae bacterium]|nr:hypothetical protein [Stellaceae bacterium]